MSSDLLGMFQMLKLPSLVDFLNKSSFDELIEMDYRGNSFRFIYNVNEKYNVPIVSGKLSDLFEFALNHSIYPDDCADYRSSVDANTIFQRLEQSSYPGVVSCRYRIKDAQGKWRLMEQMLVGTARHGVKDGFVLCYVYDIQYKADRAEGVNLVAGRSEYVDPLTGLMTQKDFFAAAEKCVSSYTEPFIFAALDLENFKIFNDWYGRETGNKILAAIGSCFLAIAEDCGGVAGYFGQDDFCIIYQEKQLPIGDLYARIVRITRDFGVSLGFLPSLGYAVSGADLSLLDLYDRAALACHKAKGDFKNRIKRFEMTMFRQTSEEYRILSDFQRALADGEILFYLQPQCRASSGKIVGAESLARWRKKDGTFVSPAVFVPILEKYGFVADLDLYIWEEVCKWLKKQMDAGAPLIPVSVNISQIDVFTMDVPDCVSNLINRYELPPKALKIEITESACGEDSNQVRATIAELRRRGFSVLMDDFGSGYSSLNVLHEMTFDVIKLDAKFLHSSKDSAARGMHILESVVNMAKTIELPIIVEGVETEDQKNYLMSLGCRYIQGYYFYSPMPTRDFEKLISDPDMIDSSGFVAKSNEQFRVREFLNDTVYSDAMLNSIIGPVAIYAWKGDSVNIIRYNQQFYEAVGVSDFNARMDAIERFMPAEDAKALFDVLRRAIDSPLNGATSGVLTFFRNDGLSSRFQIHFYFLGETDGCKRFYGAARDVTDLANLTNHMRIMERYYSDTIIFLLRSNRGFDFQVGAHGLASDLQIDREQLEKELVTGQFFGRVVKEDSGKMLAFTDAAINKGHSFSTDFRLNSPAGVVLLFMKCDIVDDLTNDVRCIISISRIRPQTQ